MIEAVHPDDEYAEKDEEYEAPDFTESHEPTFEEPYDWEELMDGIETPKFSRNDDVGLEYLAKLDENQEVEQYLEESQI